MQTAAVRRLLVLGLLAFMLPARAEDAAPWPKMIEVTSDFPPPALPAGLEDATVLPRLELDPAAVRDPDGLPLRRPDGSRLYYRRVNGGWYVRELRLDGKLAGEYFHRAGARPADEGVDKPVPRKLGAIDPAFELHGIVGVTGHYPGSAGVFVVDIDGDGTRELVEGGSYRWQVHEPTSPDHWDPTGAGELAGRGKLLSMLAHAPAGPDAQPWFVSYFADGRIRRSDDLPPRTRWQRTLTSSGYNAVECDVDSDGTVEIVVSGADLVYLDPKTGDIELQAPLSRAAYVAAGDVDADGSMEVVVTSDRGWAGVVLDAQTLTTEWSIPPAEHVDLADLDRDGTPEIVLTLAEEERKGVKVLDGATHAVRWSYEQRFGGDPGPLVFADMNADGFTDVVWSHDDWESDFRVADGLSGKMLWVVRKPSYMVTGMTATNLDSDEQPEILFASYGLWSDSKTSWNVLDLGDPEPLWQDVHRYPAVGFSVAGDHDGNRAPDLAVLRSAAEYNGPLTMELRDGENRRLLRGPVPLTIDGAAFSVAAVASGDVDGDHRDEVIVAGNAGGNFVGCWRPGGGEPVWLTRPPGYEKSSMLSLLVTDLDGDGRSEVLAGGAKRDSGSGTFVYALEGNGGALRWRSVHVDSSADSGVSVIERVAGPDGDRFAALGGGKEVVLLAADGGTLGRIRFSSSRIPVALASADDDGDGFGEIYVAMGNGDVEVWSSEPLAPSTTFIGALPPSVLSVAAGPAGTLVVNSTGSYPDTYDRLALYARANMVQVGETLYLYDGDLAGRGFSDGDADGRQDFLLRTSAGAVQATTDDCPDVANPGQRDADVDGLGDACDNCPFVADSLPQGDADGDDLGDACDPDADGDEVLDDQDNCLGVNNPTQDDADADGRGDSCDNCPRAAGPQADNDQDGAGDICDPDDDDDGWPDDEDLCPDTPGGATEDVDFDGTGDPCDDDLDGDGFPNTVDTCPYFPSPDQRVLHWGAFAGDACANDADEDRIPFYWDNCPRRANRLQEDADGDGTGDACDPDQDGDGALADLDVCPSVFDPAQTDRDADGTGDACDTTVDEHLRLAWTFPGALPGGMTNIGGSADVDGDGTTEILLYPNPPSGQSGSLWGLLSWDDATGWLDFESVAWTPAGGPQLLKRGLLGRPAIVRRRYDGKAEQIDASTQRVLGPRSTVAVTGPCRPPADADGDGVEELFLRDTYGVVVLDGETLEHKAWFYTNDLAVGDVTGDGRADIVLANGEVYDPVRMTLVATSPVSVTSIAGLADVDDDGTDEVLLILGTPRALAAWDLDRQGLLWISPAESDHDFFPTSAVVRDAAGRVLVAVRNTTSEILLLDGASGAIARRVPIAGSAAFASVDFDQDGSRELYTAGAIYDPRSESITPAPVAGGPPLAAAGDLDQDGTTDVALALKSGSLVARLDLDTGRLRAGTIQLDGDDYLTQLGIEDISGGRAPELIVGATTSLAVRSLPEGAPLWKVDLPYSSADTPVVVSRADGRAWVFAHGAMVAGDGTPWLLPSGTPFGLLDLDGDGTKSIIVADSPGLRALDPVTGKQERTYGTGNIAAELADGPVLYYAGGDSLDRIDPFTQSTLWSVTGPWALTGMTVVAPPAGNPVVVGDLNNVPSWVDPVTGATLWSGPALPRDPRQVLPAQSSSGRRFVIFVTADQLLAYEVDACPLLPGTDRDDADRDGAGDACDTCPAAFDPAQRDSDHDGLGDACDDDEDGDGALDANDVCPEIADASQIDSDGDGFGDACDNCVHVASPSQADLDRDGSGDACDPDVDGDGIVDDADVCPGVSDPLQRDSDGDGLGDACDLDDDGDGLADAIDLCPLVMSPVNHDYDMDGAGDPCDSDDDNDGIGDTADPCPHASGASPTDVDADGMPDLCDEDDDGDGLGDRGDVCPLVPDPAQADADGDGLGDSCDPTPGGVRLAPLGARWLTVEFGRKEVSVLHGSAAGPPDLLVAHDNGWLILRRHADGFSVPFNSRFRPDGQTDYNSVKSVAPGDLDGDGRDEIVAAYADSTLTVHDASGRRLASRKVPFGTSGVLSIAEMDGQAPPEIVTYDNGTAAVIDSATLTLRRSIPGWASWAVADVDADGIGEYVTVSSTGLTVRSAATGVIELNEVLPGIRLVVAVPRAGGGTDLFGVEKRNGVYTLVALDLRTRTLQPIRSYPSSVLRLEYSRHAGIVAYGGSSSVPNWVIAFDPATARETFRLDSPWYDADVAAADYDGDGTVEVAVAGLLAMLPVTDTSAPEWRHPRKGTSGTTWIASPAGRSPAPLLLAQGDPTPNLRLDAENPLGRVLAGSTLPPEYVVGAAAADVEGHATPDLALLTFDPTFPVFQLGADGQFSVRGRVDLACSSIAYADVDGCGRPELICGRETILALDALTFETRRSYEPVNFTVSAITSWPPAPAAARWLLVSGSDNIAVFDAAAGALLALQPFNYFRVQNATWLDWDGDGDPEALAALSYMGDADRVMVYEAPSLHFLAQVAPPRPFRRFAPVHGRGELVLSASQWLVDWRPIDGTSFELAVPDTTLSSLVLADFDADRHLEIATTGAATCWLARFGRTVHAPVARFAPQGRYECNGSSSHVVLDGMLSQDEDSRPGTLDDITSFGWLWGPPGGPWSPLADTVSTAVDLPLGPRAFSLTVTDTGGETSTAEAILEVVDTRPPTGEITFPANGACLGPREVPLTIADDLADVCDPGPLARSYEPVGPEVSEHGDHSVRLAATDASGNHALREVAFTIDVVPPAASLHLDVHKLKPGPTPLSLVISSSDNDGAAGGPTWERLLIDDCLLMDGRTEGDRDGRLVDEAVEVTQDLLCRASTVCGVSAFQNPVIRFEVRDCAGNLAQASEKIRGTWSKAGDCPDQARRGSAAPLRRRDAR
ncbi:MAG: thrombospondin type 3 repeat-containing protein [Acidobacteria bacterium]|nr:thrombospondin type 3 repeat-containing protein [Acidobacteriota bacterium]